MHIHIEVTEHSGKPSSIDGCFRIPGPFVLIAVSPQEVFEIMLLYMVSSLAFAEQDSVADLADPKGVIWRARLRFS